MNFPVANILCQRVHERGKLPQDGQMGPNIRKRMTTLGMKQNALAEKVGISPGYLSEILSGKKQPSLDTLERLAEALETSPADLHGAPAPRAHGFAETAGSFVSPAQATPPGLEQTLAASPGRAAYVVNAPAIGLGLLAGDTIVLQLGAPAHQGAVVIATEVDEMGAGTSFVARRVGDFFLLADPTQPPKRAINGTTITVMGVVVAVFRQMTHPSN